MIIKSIRLNNIRSYKDSYIEFPSSSTLLSGNVGSGKSTILLAIEFALFGLSSSLTGDSLLRNGEDNGSVELNLEIDNKKVSIRRMLKAGSDSITQGSGYFEVDNEGKKLSPLELKQAVIELLNYPKELLTKSKSLIYKYTVYTPQEAMKHILLGDMEIRLDILRKVFGIDKYKRIKENSLIIINKLKERKKELSGIIIDLDDKKDELKEISEKELVILPHIEKIKELVNYNLNKIEAKKTEISGIENSINEFRNLSTKKSIIEIKIQNSLDRKKRNEKELTRIELQLKEYGDIKFLDLENIKASIKAKENELELNEKELKILNERLSQLNERERSSLEIKKSIENLDICPICKQKVSQEHKENIIDNENNNIGLISNKIKQINLEKNDKENKLSLTKKELGNLRLEERRIELNNHKTKDIEEKRKAKEELLSNNAVIEKEIIDLKTEKDNLNNEINKYSDIEKFYSENKKELDLLLENQKKLEISKSSYDIELKVLLEKKSCLINEISKKEEVKGEIQNLSSAEYWLDSSFINLIETVEKQVMLRVYYDFNGLFQKWFSMLIDNENLIARLSENFSPIIEQNGYDIDYNYLSGGEKTACALAYRLALNQVINNLMSNIKTNDLLILDEPTDGFSDEQLDRMRDVLQELNIKQTIIVSHESKVEGFVDHIIRLQKINHETMIVSN